MPTVTLSVRCDQTKWGELVAAVGSWNSWDTNNFTTFTTTPHHFPKWTANIQIPDNDPNKPLEYKYVIVSDGRLARWEVDGTRNNRIVQPSDSSVTDDFGRIPKSHAKKPAQPREYEPRNWKQSGVTAPSASGTVSSSLDDLEKAVVKLTSEQRSWRQRLAFVRSLFTDENVALNASFDTNSLDHLVTVSAYITFLASGQLRCEEDGGHHRPNHHAQEAQKIERALASITSAVADASDAAPELHSYIPYVIRRIYPQLPSYSSQFTASVPLTRIRDIAHRGDIPHDFKQEIKHTLQNKLHRCAGPEDLKTSERLLERINHGNFSHDLKEQFHIFHEELRAFFNASSLDDRLRYLEHSDRSRPVAGLASALLGLKHGWRDASVQLESLTNLRKGIASLDVMSLNSSASSLELPGEDMQKTRLADIELENYAFVLLAGIAKDVEAEAPSQSFPWSFGLTGLSRALDNIVLSSICPLETSAIASELVLLSKEHKKQESAPRREVLLRTKAAIDRALRFMHDFSTAISDVYSRRVESIGSALNIDQHSISVFAEAEIRSNIAFQASRIADTCAKACRGALSLPPWDPLFVGEAAGKLVFAEALSEIPIIESEPIVAVCQHAEGDEDIPSCVKGLILGRPIPHLSHLGVRARQAGVIVVCAEEKAAFDAVWKQRNMSAATLVVNSTEGLASLTDTRLSLAKPTPEQGKDRTSESVTQPIQIDVDTSVNIPVGIEKATPLTTSSKSTFAGKLSRLAGTSDGLFEAPGGVALPHGMFHYQRTKNSKQYERLVLSYNDSHSSAGDTEVATAALRELILKDFAVNSKTCKTVQDFFEKDTRVMVRSSANAEDLEEMSGAGLYDSIANVDVYNDSELGEAVKKVWASLWTKRAASSRTSYGVSHEQVSMAVLIQEMVRADVSFVAFSKDPVTKNDNSYVEMAIGMGETLASATSEGSPYRFRVAQGSGKVETVSFASYAEALVPGAVGLKRQVVDYSKEKLTTNSEVRAQIVWKIARSVWLMEMEFGGPQDVEGAISFEEERPRIFIVQARPQIL